MTTASLNITEIRSLRKVCIQIKHVILQAKFSYLTTTDHKQVNTRKTVYVVENVRTWGSLYDMVQYSEDGIPRQEVLHCLLQHYKFGHKHRVAVICSLRLVSLHFKNNVAVSEFWNKSLAYYIKL